MDWRFGFEVGSTVCFQSTVVVAATFALQRWVTDARSSCRLWTVCFVCVIGLVTAALLLPHRRLFHFPDTLDRETVLAVVVWQQRMTLTLATLWGAGVAVSCIRKVLLYWQLMRFLQACKPVDVARLRSLGLDAGDQKDRLLQLPTNLHLLASPDIQGPFCWQLHRPVIVLPTYLLKEQETMLQHILLHELQHLRAMHPMQYFLQGVCSTIFWFHPLVWSAARDAELNREYFCDEVAARAAGKFAPYLRTLAMVADRCRSIPCTGSPRGALAFGNRPSVLMRRCHRLVQLAEGGKRLSPWRSGVAIAALLIFTGLIQQLWLPTNAMASQRSGWSPWPRWTAAALHQLEIQVRDFESFEERVQLHELLVEDAS